MARGDKRRRRGRDKKKDAAINSNAALVKFAVEPDPVPTSQTPMPNLPAIAPVPAPKEPEGAPVVNNQRMMTQRLHRKLEKTASEAKAASVAEMMGLVAPAAELGAPTPPESLALPTGAPVPEIEIPEIAMASPASDPHEQASFVAPAWPAVPGDPAVDDAGPSDAAPTQEANAADTPLDEAGSTDAAAHVAIPGEPVSGEVIPDAVPDDAVSDHEAVAAPDFSEDGAGLVNAGADRATISDDEFDEAGAQDPVSGDVATDGVTPGDAGSGDAGFGDQISDQTALEGVDPRGDSWTGAEASELSSDESNQLETDSDQADSAASEVDAAIFDRSSEQVGAGPVASDTVATSTASDSSDGSDVPEDDPDAVAMASMWGAIDNAQATQARRSLAPVPEHRLDPDLLWAGADKDEATDVGDLVPTDNEPDPEGARDAATEADVPDSGGSVDLPLPDIFAAAAADASDDLENSSGEDSDLADASAGTTASDPAGFDVTGGAPESAAAESSDAAETSAESDFAPAPLDHDDALEDDADLNSHESDPDNSDSDRGDAAETGADGISSDGDSSDGDSSDGDSSDGDSSDVAFPGLPSIAGGDSGTTKTSRTDRKARAAAAAQARAAGTQAAQGGNQPSPRAPRRRRQEPSKAVLEANPFLDPSLQSALAPRDD